MKPCKQRSRRRAGTKGYTSGAQKAEHRCAIPGFHAKWDRPSRQSETTLPLVRTRGVSQNAGYAADPRQAAVPARDRSDLRVQPRRAYPYTESRRLGDRMISPPAPIAKAHRRRGIVFRVVVSVAVALGVTALLVALSLWLIARGVSKINLNLAPVLEAGATSSWMASNVANIHHIPDNALTVPFLNQQWSNYRWDSGTTAVPKSGSTNYVSVACRTRRPCHRAGPRCVHVRDNRDEPD